MEVRTFEIGPGNTERWPAIGRYVRILEAAEPVKVTTDTDVDSQILPGLGGNLADQATGEPFTWVRFGSDVTQTITAVVSPFPVTDNRIVGSVNALIKAYSSLEGLAPVTPDGAGTIAANLDRSRLDIVADPDNAGRVWVGATASGQGVPLTPGGTYQIAVTGDIPVFSDQAGDTLYLVEVL